MRPCVVIGNPGDRRVTFFQQALSARGLAAATVISYHELISGQRPLEELIPPGSIVRIDSPGENFEIERLLLREGMAAAVAENSPCISDRQLESLPFDRGLILFPRQWYLGFCAVLRRLESGLKQVPDVWCVTPPADIAVLFDKRECQARLTEHEIAVPRGWGPIRSYEEFIATANRRNAHRAFVKLAHGSSASGVVAWRRQGTQQVAITSTEIVRDEGQLRLYNSLKIRRYTDTRDIAQLIDVLAAEQVQVEDWFCKATISRGNAIDLRIVTIAGRPCHMVVRQSTNPMTNLHLGNQRGDLTIVSDRLGIAQQEAIFASCRKAAAAFPDSLMLGLDVGVGTKFNRHVLFEANAFGDLLPGILHQGVDTYTAQVDAITAQAD